MNYMEIWATIIRCILELESETFRTLSATDLVGGPTFFIKYALAMVHTVSYILGYSA